MENINLSGQSSLSGSKYDVAAQVGGLPPLLQPFPLPLRRVRGLHSLLTDLPTGYRHRSCDRSASSLWDFLCGRRGGSWLRYSEIQRFESLTAPNVIFVAVASSVAAREGILGLSLSTLLAGILLMFFGAIRLGAAIQGLPRPVVLGWTTGIAVSVVSQQLPDLLGLSSQILGDHIIQRAFALLRNPVLEPHATLLAIAALVLVAACRRTWRHAPAGLIVIALGALSIRFAHFPVQTVGALHGSGPMFPLPLAEVLKFNSFGRIIAPAFAIAVLVAVESLQAVDVATGLTGESANPDGELVLQGSANLTSAFVGGLPLSGVPSHTLENVHLGAQTPVGGILQAVLLGVFLLIAAPVLRLIPLPMISALILSSFLVMTTWQEIPRLLKGPRFEAVAWAAISLLTIFADLPAAIAAGMLIGMFLYIRKKPTILSKAARGRSPKLTGD